MASIHLKTIRRRRKLTQAALAARIGKPQSYISKLENGAEPDPRGTVLQQLGKALDVDPLTLRFGATGGRSGAEATA